MNNPLDSLMGKNPDGTDPKKVLDTSPRENVDQEVIYPTGPTKAEREIAMSDVPAASNQEQTEEPKKEEVKKQPSKDAIEDSRTALNKIKRDSIAFSKQTRFVQSVAGFTAVMVMRREDGTQIVESLRPYSFIRDQQNNIAWSVFKKPKKRLGKFVITSEKIERIFNAELAMPTINGYLSCHDAGSFAQIPFTQNKDLVSLFHKLDAQINQTNQAMIMVNSESARKKQKGTFWERYASSIMLTLCMIMLAIALLELGSDISGFGNQISNLAGILGNLPTGAISKVVGSTNPVSIVLALIFP